MHIYHKRVLQRGAKSGELKGTNLKQSTFCVHAIGQIQAVILLIQSIILLSQPVVLIQGLVDAVRFDWTSLVEKFNPFLTVENGHFSFETSSQISNFKFGYFRFPFDNSFQYQYQSYFFRI